MSEPVTLYNHKEVTTGSLPIIPNEFFKETIASLDRGEKDFYELIITEYSLETTQKRIAEGLYKKIQ